MPNKQKNKSKINKKRLLPTKSQWKGFFKTLNKKEKSIFSFLLSLALLSGLFLSLNFYIAHTQSMPDYGGEYKEGLIGQPRFINPLYLSTQDADRDIVEIIFSGLMKYDENGKLTEDLIKGYEIKEDSKVYAVELKDNIFWHDGEPITTDDVVFTIGLIQEPQTQSALAVKWMGIAVEKMSDKIIQFRLTKKYSSFLENLTVKILPKHIFQDIAPKDLPWKLISQRYLVGSGPYVFKDLSQNKTGEIKQMEFGKNTNYHGKTPYINKIVFNFYPNIEELVKAARIGDIDGFSLTDPKYFKSAGAGFKPTLLSIPRYFAVFFNLNAENLFSDAQLRKALAIAIDKQTILKQVFLEKGKVINSPILAGFFELGEPAEPIQYNIEKAVEELDKIGFKLNEQTGKREQTVAQKPAFTFTRDLTFKSQGNDVTELQKCLASPPAGGSDIYPEGTISGYFGAKTKAAVIRFQEKYAADILQPIGLTKGTGDVKPMTREKLNEVCFQTPEEFAPLEITITTCDKFPLLEIAKIVKENWEAVGATVNIDKVSLADLQTETLAKRNFDLLLFGEALGSIPDPFPFWHSTQINYPGLNISGYQSKTVDQLLESIREAEDEQTRQSSFEKFQNTLLADAPAIFLVRPDFVYMLPSKIKGYTMEKITEPSKRFSTISDWYIKTKRVWQ